MILYYNHSQVFLTKTNYEKYKQTEVIVMLDYDEE